MSARSRLRWLASDPARRGATSRRGFDSRSKSTSHTSSARRVARRPGFRQFPDRNLGVRGDERNDLALADRLAVSQRTIRRDVERLRELGYGIESARGSAGGYRLEAGTGLPPLLLTDDEGVAIAVGLRSQATADNGEIVAAMLDGEATVKTFRQRDGHTWLLPRNSAFEPILGDEAVVLGKVVAVLRAV